VTTEHADKFAGFIRLCREAKENGVEVAVVSHPQVLGDNYAEVITNLGLLAEHGLALSIASKG
jgi:hypothetical protein